MGRDWYWGSGAKTSSSKSSRRAAERDSGGQTSPFGCISSVFHLFDFHHFQFPLNQQTGSSSCSSCFKPDSFLFPDPITTLKGVEAPRNSLESEEEGSTSASLTSTSKEEILNIPVGIQIKTRGDNRSKVEAPNNDTSSEISSSPGTKTPTLVARLMGLDLLPESRSPSFSSTPNFHANKSHLNHHHNVQSRKPLQSKTTTGHRNSLDGDFRGTRSLPETPRISSARRSDVDHHHRLSLQINKENMSASEELVISCLSSLKKKELKHEDDNKSSGHYARQIVKQVKESVSRNVGMDITNTVKNREQAREELVSQFKYKKISRALTIVGDDLSPGKHSTPSCSPRLRFLESKTKPVINYSCTKDHNSQPSKPSSFSLSSVEIINIQPQPIGVLPKPKLQSVEEEQEQQVQLQPPRAAASKCKKGSSTEKFGSKLKKPQQTSDIILNKKEEPFVLASTANRVNIPDKKCRKTTLSNNMTVPTLLPVKKDPSPPATKIPQKQVLDAQRPKRSSSQLSSCSSQKYNKQEEETHVHVVRDNTNNGDRCNGAAASTSTTGDEAETEYYEYIFRILRCTGLDKDTPVSFTPWFSPSHPLDPSIFYYLEHFTTCSTIFNNYNKTKSSQLRHRCNRKLVFHLVNEILVEILKPHFNLRPWVTTVGHDFMISHMDGSRLIDTLCSKIRSFPQADCRVLEDIDGLIDKDLPEMKHQGVEKAYDEEGEGIVTEIEKDILESLVHETTADFVARV